MPPIDTDERLSAAELHLARRLLDSAQLDEPPLAAAAAWERFSGTLARVTRQSAPSVAEAPVPTTRRRPGIFANSLRALHWVTVGAIAGSAVTAAWLSRAARSNDAGALPAGAVSAATPATPAASAVTLPVASLHLEGSASTPSAPPPPAPTPSSPQRTAATPSDTLAAEVSLLDAARTALAVGGFGEAKRLIAQYQRQFPRGELSLEAQVVRIEALSANGDSLEAHRAGSRFLAEHPHDPHAERVHRLLEATPLHPQ